MTKSTSSISPNSDVRMKGFTGRATVEETITWIDQHSQVLESHQISLESCYARILAENVVARVNVPNFRRAMMDGYAVLSDDIAGAGIYNPLVLKVVGQSLPGDPFEGKITAGQAISIMTGAAVPDSANAVLPAEKVEAVENDQIKVTSEVPLGKHVGPVGEDITTGDVILNKGRKLRPQDVGVLSSVGVQKVSVVQQPKVKLLITGNELLTPGSQPKGTKIVDANSPMLSALVQRDGGVVLNPGIIPDDPDLIFREMNDPSADVIIVSGGSSVGIEDHAPIILNQHGELAIHGIAMRPSSPTGMGTMNGRFVFLLPGNPVSCLCAYDFFAARAIRRLAGLSTNWPYRKVTLKLSQKISSVVGRLDYARVSLVEGQVQPIAIAGASILSSASLADGFVVVPADSEGFALGSEVEVYLYD